MNFTLQRQNSEVVEYALFRLLSPTMASEYQMQIPDKKFNSEEVTLNCLKKNN